MVNPRQLIGAIALALASLGPIPLWLHHATEHSGSCSHAAKSTAEQGCHADHKHVGNQTAGVDGQADSPQCPSDLAQLEEQHGHDCAVCYILGQATSTATAPNLNESLLFTFEHFSHVEISLLRVDFSHRPRGPPQLLG
jgi:hypothetical protein